MMDERLREALAALAENPWLQGALAGSLTFILEDPVTFGSALLVADGKMGYTTALIGLSIGITLGDWWLYVMGRYVGTTTVRWGLVSRGRLERAKRWFEANMIAAIFVSRFVPGLRLPTNVAAGMMHAAARRYLPLAFLASCVWTFTIITLVSWLGAMVLPYLGALKWPLGITLVLLLVYIQFRSAKYLEDDVSEPEAPAGATASVFEFWPPAVFYAPVAVYYLWLALRYRSLTLPTAANPSIYSGGMIRESKSDVLSLVPESFRQHIAPYVTYRRPESGTPEGMAAAALASLESAGLSLPVVAKPDIGFRGAGVRPIREKVELETYLSEFPAGERVCLQRLVPYSMEAGILYYRLPGEARGCITSITLKEFPFVVGDGRQSLRELIDAHERARETREVFFRRHAERLAVVIPDGEKFPLVFAGNHKQGCVFRDGIHILTPALETFFDRFATAIPDFYFGRFDVRFHDLASFQAAQQFQIVEINGAGAEATHIWDPDARLADAYQALFGQFRVLFRIGAANRKAGRKPLGPVRFLRDFLLYHRVARHYPRAH